MAESKEKTTRHRSPAYPAVGLREAVERAEKFYKIDRKAGAPPEIAVKHMGFATAHGQAMAVLAALKKFGLVGEANGRIVPTQRAIEIIELRPDDERRAQALREAALSPTIYRELIEQHRESGWPGDDVLQSELITYKNFNRNAVEGFVKDLRESLEYAGLSEIGALELSLGDQLSMDDSLQVRSEAPVQQAKTGGGGSGTGAGAMRIVKEILSQRVSPDCVAQVVFDGPVTQRAVEKLIAHLQLAKDNYPDNGSTQ